VGAAQQCAGDADDIMVGVEQRALAAVDGWVGLVWVIAPVSQSPDEQHPGQHR
jgi:hypothetical protein